jgi:hypothetical protein
MRTLIFISDNLQSLISHYRYQISERNRFTQWQSK